MGLNRLRRGERFNTEEKLNEMIDAINAALLIHPGPGLELKRTAAGTMLSLAPSMRQMERPRGAQVFYQPTEPAPEDWKPADIWIDTSTQYESGKYQQGWMKTIASDVNNDSKVAITILVAS